MRHILILHVLTHKQISRDAARFACGKKNAPARAAAPTL
jgi:hypothetical protein